MARTIRVRGIDNTTGQEVIATSADSLIPSGGGGGASADTSVNVMLDARSADNVTSVALSAALSVVASALSARIDTVSNAVCNEISLRAANSAVLDKKISDLSAMFVTAEQRISAVSNVASDALSVGQAASAAAKDLSDRFSVVSDKVSNLSINVISLQARVSAVSAQTSAPAEAKGLQTAIDALSNKICNTASAFSAASATLDTKISDLSARYVSGLAALSQNISTLSVAHDTLSARVVSGLASVDGHVDTVSNAVCNEVSLRAANSATLDAKISSLSTLFMNLSQNVSTISVQANTLCNRISDEISNRTSASAVLDAKISTLSTNVVNTSVALQSASYKRTYTWVVSAPAAAAGMYGTQVPQTMKATKAIIATLTANTSWTINIEKRPTFGAAGSALLSTAKEGSATPVSQAADTSAGAATITAGNWLYLTCTATSGSPAVGIVVLEVEKP